MSLMTAIREGYLSLSYHYELYGMKVMHEGCAKGKESVFSDIYHMKFGTRLVK